MATTCFGQQQPESPELATFVPDEVPLPGIAVAPDRADPSPGPAAPAGEPRLAIGQMVASVQDGLLMVLGPEGDPVPPQAFVNAAAAEPEASVTLSDGAAVPASRVAIVLKAQTLGRLGAAEDGGWIMTMLRDNDRPEAASEQDLAAEHDDVVLTGDRTPPDQPSAPGPEQVEPPSPSPGLDLAASVAGSAAPADAVDADSIVLVTIRGVPEDVRLSAGVRDEDGSWSLSPLDLPDLTITPASGQGSGEIGDRELTITGIALTESGALATVTETVPLTDYLTGAAHEPQAGGDRAAIALEVDPTLLHGEEFDALVVRDLPAGARLSAGAHDPAIDGWVLRPQDLSALTIIPPPDQRADFTLTLLGVVLRPGAADAARVLTRLPVRLG